MHCPELVIATNDLIDPKLKQLSVLLNLPLVNKTQKEQLTTYFLSIENDTLCLLEKGVKAGPVAVDFLDGAASYRRIKGGGELIVKAMGGVKQQRPLVLDLTAGLGRDSFVLASWGFKVQMVERSAVVAALLEDGIRRASREGDEEISAIMANMQLIHGDSEDYLMALDKHSPELPDIIYLDPMFPASKKTALVKKEMRAFHYLVGDEQADSELLAMALGYARHRVVVKRPAKAPFLESRKPNFSLEGKAVRFDIYTIKAFAK